MSKKILILTLILSAFFVASCSKNNKLDNFAKCLTEKNVKFYGAFWCPHCRDQKSLFKNSIKFVNYIECSTPDGRDQLQTCKDAKIEGYPTWQFSGGSRMSRVVSLKELSSKSGCAIS